MSDGNFNRALLPHTPYASGLKAGKAIARNQALATFEAWLSDAMPTLTLEEHKQMLADYRRRLVSAVGL